jgi:hypothetical protein
MWSPTQPGLDCISRGHLWVEHRQPGVWPTENGATPYASWCLWCGGGMSNELLPED